MIVASYGGVTPAMVKAPIASVVACRDPMTTVAPGTPCFAMFVTLPATVMGAACPEGALPPQPTASQINDSNARQRAESMGPFVRSSIPPPTTPRLPTLGGCCAEPTPHSGRRPSRLGQSTEEYLGILR